MDSSFNVKNTQIEIKIVLVCVALDARVGVSFVGIVVFIKVA